MTIGDWLLWLVVVLWLTAAVTPIGLLIHICCNAKQFGEKDDQ